MAAAAAAAAKLLAKTISSYPTPEEKQCADLLFSDVTVNMGDQRLNSMAALTYNMQSCESIFAIVEKALNPSENQWKTLYKVRL